MKFNKGLSF